ncbi:hypothetical protein BZG36_00512 [Bifiguratus adelaidae]|uniref:Uncharacterized protein n=1 Tax=Bifiguratus adelaidae TaxID=1938954 RepID=A0A261Y7G7_9FUNG|nr:hypothetical protein BZG36_00512 [Bifiguratus adelaidae]
MSDQSEHGVTVEHAQSIQGEKVVEGHPEGISDDNDSIARKSDEDNSAQHADRVNGSHWENERQTTPQAPFPETPLMSTPQTKSTVPLTSTPFANQLALLNTVAQSGASKKRPLNEATKKDTSRGNYKYHPPKRKPKRANEPLHLLLQEVAKLFILDEVCTWSEEIIQQQFSSSHLAEFMSRLRDYTSSEFNCTDSSGATFKTPLDRAKNRLDAHSNDVMKAGFERVLSQPERALERLQDLSSATKIVNDCMLELGYAYEHSKERWYKKLKKDGAKKRSNEAAGGKEATQSGEEPMEGQAPRGHDEAIDVQETNDEENRSEVGDSVADDTEDTQADAPEGGSSKRKTQNQESPYYPKGIANVLRLWDQARFEERKQGRAESGQGGDHGRAKEDAGRGPVGERDQRGGRQPDQRNDHQRRDRRDRFLDRERRDRPDHGTFRGYQDRYGEGASYVRNNAGYQHPPYGNDRRGPPPPHYASPQQYGHSQTPGVMQAGPPPLTQQQMQAGNPGSSTAGYAYAYTAASHQQAHSTYPTAPQASASTPHQTVYSALPSTYTAHQQSPTAWNTQGGQLQLSMFKSRDPGRHSSIPLPTYVYLRDFLAGPVYNQPRLSMPAPHQILGTIRGYIIRDAEGNIGISEYLFETMQQ